MNIDGDDWIERERILHAVEQLQEERFDMVYMGGYVQDFLEERAFVSDSFGEMTFHRENMPEVFPLLQSPCHAFQRTFRGLLWQWCMRRELCLEAMHVDDSISMGEDLLGVWRCALKARSIRAFRETSYHYVQRPQSLTWAYDPREKNRMELLKGLLLKAVADSAYGNLETVMAAAVKACFLAVVLSDCTLLLRAGTDYLFPFPKVRLGSRIAVYGAGKMGFHVCDAVQRTGCCEVVMVCDGNSRRPPVCGFDICPPSALLSADYDFVVVAVAYEEMARDIESRLVAMGLEPEKVARMDASVMDERALERIFG